MTVRVGLVADEELLAERAELAAGEIAVDAAGRLAHFVVGEEDAGGHELGDFLGFGHDAAAALGPLRGGAELGIELIGIGIPLEAIGMAGEAALDDLLEAACAVPRALIVGVEHVALGIEADAAGRADAAGGGDELAVGRDLAGPAAELARWS